MPRPPGRAFEKLPPAYTVLPTTSCVHTMPESICTVGRGSAVTVELLRCSIGAGPFSAADAGAAVPNNIPTATTAAAVSMARPLLLRLDSNSMICSSFVLQAMDPWNTTTGAPAA